MAAFPGLTESKSASSLQALALKDRTIVKWVNAVLGSSHRHTRVATLLEDLADGVILLRLASEILGVDLVNSSDTVFMAPKNRREYIANATAALRAFEVRTIVPACKPTCVVDKSKSDVLPLLYQWARCREGGMHSRGALNVFESSLVKDVRDTLGSLKKYSPLLDHIKGVQIFDTYTSFLDGRLFIALLVSAGTNVDLNEAESMSPAERRTCAFTLAEKEYHVPPLLVVGDDTRSAEQESFSLYVAALLKGLRSSSIGNTAEMQLQLLQAREKIEALQLEYHEQDKKYMKMLHVKDEALREASAANIKAMRSLEEAELELVSMTEMGEQNAHTLERLSKQVAFYDSDKGNTMRGVLPPEGEVALMFTDVQGSTAQWASNSSVMADALMLHNETIRSVMAKHCGYEVKTEGDAFMVAFQSPQKAVHCARAIQLALLKALWDHKLLKNKDSLEERSTKGRVLFRGLRVRIGIHAGTPLRAVDPTTGRMDYFGPMVNEASRIEGMSQGGIALISQAVMERVHEDLPSGVELVDVGHFALKGVPDPVRLYKMTIAEIAERPYVRPDKAPAQQSEVLEVELSRAKQENSKLVQKIDGLKRSQSTFLADLQSMHKSLKAASAHGRKDSVRPGEATAAAAVARLQHDFNVLRKEMDSLVVANEQLKSRISVPTTLDAMEVATLKERATKLKEQAQDIMLYFFPPEGQQQETGSSGGASGSSLTSPRGEVVLSKSPGGSMRSIADHQRRLMLNDREDKPKKVDKLKRTKHMRKRSHSDASLPVVIVEESPRLGQMKSEPHLYQLPMASGRRANPFARSVDLHDLVRAHDNQPQSAKEALDVLNDVITRLNLVVTHTSKAPSVTPPPNALRNKKDRKKKKVQMDEVVQVKEFLSPGTAKSKRNKSRRKRSRSFDGGRLPALFGGYGSSSGDGFPALTGRRGAASSDVCRQSPIVTHSQGTFKYEKMPELAALAPYTRGAPTSCTPKHPEREVKGQLHREILLLSQRSQSQRRNDAFS